MLVAPFHFSAQDSDTSSVGRYSHRSSVGLWVIISTHYCKSKYGEQRNRSGAAIEFQWNEVIACICRKPSECSAAFTPAHSFLSVAASH